MEEKIAESARLRQVADQLECLIEDDFATLANITPGTAEAWRKRRQGPEWIRIGNRVLYPLKSVAAHLESLPRHPPRSLAKDLL